MSDFVDPPPAPEVTDRLKAPDLKNRVVILRATGSGNDPEKLDKNGRMWEWTTCDVWVLDRTGIEMQDVDLRISWWRVREQLAAAGEGVLIAGKVTENDDRSITLSPLTGKAREVAGKVAGTISAAPPADEPADGYSADEEPF